MKTEQIKQMAEAKALEKYPHQLGNKRNKRSLINGHNHGEL